MQATRPMLRQAARRSLSTKTLAADYVICGAGSAGSVLANRLSADGTHSVLLLEAGPWDVGAWDSWKIQIPAALTHNLADDAYNWDYWTEPQEHLNGRRLNWPRGRVAGGSSSLNAMVYVRGHALDYDRWAHDEGAAGWSYADCLPYFKRAQCHDGGEDDYRGGEGPLHVTSPTIKGDGNGNNNGGKGPGGDKVSNELFDAFIQAGVEAGYAESTDLNGYRNEGFGPLDSTTYRGQRWSTANAYLRPAMGRDNLRMEMGVMVDKVEFADSGPGGGGGGSTKAVGVSADFGDGAGPVSVKAHKEVILCGGAINTPQLLMLSGIGDSEHIKSATGSLARHHLPGVGSNLQDHLDLYLQYECKKDITLYDCSWDFPENMVGIGSEWFVSHTLEGATVDGSNRATGKASTAWLESGGFIRSRAGLQHPDVQYHFLPGALTGQLTPGKCHAFQAHCSTMRATSTGTVRLASSDPRTHPVIQPNYLSTEQDVVDFRNAVKLTREVLHQDALGPYRGASISPCMDTVKTDAEIDAWVRETTESAYHPSCTAKMGDPEKDSMAVLDARLTVAGVEGLRVVDASVMPSVVSGNLNAPTIMIAEKAADIILGKTPLAPATNVPVWVAKDWQTKQR